MIDPTQLYGTWYQVCPTGTAGRDRLSLQRQCSLPMGWGQKFVFHPNGTFEDSYSTRCGNDPNIHHWVGTWEWGDDGRSLRVTADWPDPKFAGVCNDRPYPNGWRYQIEQLDQDCLVLRSLPEVL